MPGRRARGYASRRMEYRATSSPSGRRRCRASTTRRAEIFAAEQERIFSRRWLCVGRGDAIPEPGDYLARLGRRGEPPPRARRGTGAPRAFYNVCRHRGTRLCEEESGPLRGRDPVPVPRLDLRPRRRAARRRRTWPTCRGSTRRSTRCAAAPSGSGRGSCSSTSPRSPQPLDEALRPLLGRFAPWRICRRS